tara:strand:- start:3727 stop:4215 length:489 start_codon:yes stop_codon:yes gene_type:complete
LFSVQDVDPRFFADPDFEGAMMAPKKNDPTKLKKQELDEFREVLLKGRKELLAQARSVIHRENDELIGQPGDEVDQSTAEYEQAFEYRLRDREKYLLKKINKALKRIDEGTYNECEQCSAPIGVPRLRARAVATLCIECKEEQENDEKKYQKRRAYKLDFEL